MTNSQRLAKVRACLLCWLAQHQSRWDGSIRPGEVRSIEGIRSESILIRDEFYCGRRFHTARHHAVWFIEEDELKIFSEDGHLRIVLTGPQIDALAVGSFEPMVQAAAGSTRSSTQPVQDDGSADRERSRDVISFPMDPALRADVDDQSDPAVRRAA